MRNPITALARYMRRAKVTQTQLAKITKTSQQHISRIATGAMSPSFDLALRISRATGLPMDALAARKRKAA